MAVARRLSDSSGRHNGLDSNGSRCTGGSDIAVDLGLSAVTGNMTSLAAAVTGLPSGVERAAVGRCAIAGDVAQLAAGIALHGLSLAIAGEMVRSAALVTGSRASAASEAAPETSSKATATRGRANSTTSHSWVWAVAGEMAGQTTAVATSAGASSTQAESWAVGLNVAESLAVVALLGLSGAWMRAAIGLVAGLLAVVAEPLRGGTHFSIVSYVSAFEARAT